MFPFCCSSPTKPKTEYFRLRNKSNNLVLDVEGENMNPGTRLILWKAKLPSERYENQLFYENKNHGTICSVFSGMCVDANGESNYNNVHVKNIRLCHNWSFESLFMKPLTIVLSVIAVSFFEEMFEAKLKFKHEPWCSPIEYFSFYRKRGGCITFCCRQDITAMDTAWR